MYVLLVIGRVSITTHVRLLISICSKKPIKSLSYRILLSTELYSFVWQLRQNQLSRGEGGAILKVKLFFTSHRPKIKIRSNVHWRIDVTKQIWFETNFVNTVSVFIVNIEMINRSNSCNQ